MYPSWGTPPRLWTTSSRQAGVAVNDGKNYGSQGNGCLRIINGCLGSDDESEQVLQRIAQALRAYQEQD